jgi:excinuclease ABC subunit C
MNLPEKVRKKLQDIPDKPGCYLMRDRQGRIIYVGKAASLRKRVQSYFREATLRHADPKLRGLIKSVYDLEFIVLHNEAEALLTEGRLIKEYKPRYNVDFRDDKRFLLLRAESNQPFPSFKLCRIRRQDQAFYFGPYASSAAARATLDFIEKKFGLRKCTPQIPNQETYRHCINDIVRYCSAPCMGKVTESEYRARFEEVCAFLSGERPQYLKEVRERMEEAAASRDFERAAALRDTYFLLMATVKQRARVASTPEMKKEEGLAGVAELQRLLNLERPPRLIEGYDIANISGTFSVASMVSAVDGIPQKNRYRRFRIKTVEGIDDPAMMAEVVRRRYSRLAAEGGGWPDLLLVDGGITQLRAARAELGKLGLGHIPVAGLAKRFEEIYWQEEGAPLSLPGNSEALKVLQRLRDEAHRFAQAYHLQLRNKRIKESVLDEIPGIGPNKKRELLRHFGSVRRMARATEEEIAAVPGIGYELAREITHALR